jgi:hypothetical protein
MEILDSVKQHAANIELKAANFLDAKGRIPVDKRKITRVQLIFIDGTEFNVSMREFEQLGDFQFKLRPTRNDG